MTIDEMQCPVKGCIRFRKSYRKYNKWQIGKYCVMHGLRIVRNGKVGNVLSKRRGVGTGCIDGGGYLRFMYKNAPIMAHRALWEETYGKIQEGYEIHHINGNKLDNRIENLQCLSKSDHTTLHHKEGK